MIWKKLSILAAALAASAVVPAIAAGAADMTGPVGNVTVYAGAPTVDGKITAQEYQGARKLTINHTNMKALPDTFVNSKVPESLTITSYQLWDKTGLYLAFEVEDETPAPNGIDTANNWQFNGDNIQIFLDPGPSLAGQMLLDTEKLGGRRGPMYTIGVNQDGTVYLLRQLVKNEMIANLSENPPACAGKLSGNGWSYEVCIPWSMLLPDINEKLGEDVMTQERIKESLQVSAMFIYNDVELRGNVRSQIGMYETSLQTQETPFDWQPEIFGIHFILSGTKHADAPPYVESSTPEVSSERMESDASSQRVVTVSDTSTAEEGKGTASPIGIIIGTVIAVVAAAAVATVIIIIKLKKKN